MMVVYRRQSWIKQREYYVSKLFESLVYRNGLKFQKNDRGLIGNINPCCQLTDQVFNTRSP